LILCENEKGALLEPFGMLSFKDLLEDRQRIGVAALHEGVQGEQLEFFVLLRLRLNGTAALAANLDLKRTAILQPIALRVVLAQSRAGLESIGRTALPCS
jgi:hypothetical protein